MLKNHYSKVKSTLIVKTKIKYNLHIHSNEKSSLKD